MTLYTSFADIPRAALNDPTVLGDRPLVSRSILTQWVLYNSPGERMVLTDIPAAWDREAVSNDLWNQGVVTDDGALYPSEGRTTAVGGTEKNLREHGVALVKRCAEVELPFDDVVLAAKSEDFAYLIVHWAAMHGFVCHDTRSGAITLDGVLARLNEWTPPTPETRHTASPKPVTPPAPVPAKPTAPVPAKSTAPVPAKSTAPVPVNTPVTVPEHVTPAAQPPSLDLLPFVSRMVKALEIIADGQHPRPTPVTPPRASAVVDCARELAVLLDKLQPATVNVLRERVRVRLRPHTTAALELGVRKGAFQLVGSARRGGEYSLIDPDPLDLSWAAVRSESARRKPARPLAGSRGT